MNLFDILKEPFGRTPPPAQHPAHRPAHGNGFVIPEACQLEAKKAIHTLAIADRAYNLGIWRSSDDREKWLHDVAVFVAFNDIVSISLELLAEDKTVVAEVKVLFSQHVMSKAGAAPSGTEVPVLIRKLVVAHRVLVHRKGNSASYKHLLNMSWSPAETLQRRQGDEFANCQARKTGGRQNGTIFVSEDSRHLLVVSRPIGEKGYGFADCPDLGLSGVLLHIRHLHGLRGIRLGQKLTAQLIQLPAGIQAREVRAV